MSFNGGGFGGLGQPGQRVTGKMDIGSELLIPIYQALAKMALAPIIVIATFINAFLLQVNGWFILVAAVIVLLGYWVVIGGSVTLSFGERNLLLWLPGIQDLKFAVLAATPFSFLLLLWIARGWTVVFMAWYHFWPDFYILWWNICVACIHPPLWVSLLVIPSSYGLYRATRLLNFRLAYEVTDPMAPPTIRQRDWDGRTFGPGYAPRPQSYIPQQPFSTYKRTTGTTDVLKLYTPPGTVTEAEVWDWCSAIHNASDLDKEGNYKIPGEGKTGVSQDTHYALAHDWVYRKLAVYKSNKRYVSTKDGTELIQAILGYERPSEV